MNKVQKKILKALTLSIFIVGVVSSYSPAALAASTSSHVRIVGSTQTIWYGDVTTDGCTVTDTDNKSHVFTQPLAICALDAASKTGGFSYSVKDFGGSLGLFLHGIASDIGAADFSTYWSYDLNRIGASQGIANQLLNNSDSLYFHFEDPSIDLNKRSETDGITYLRSQQQASGQISGFTGISSWSTITFAAAGITPETVQNGGSSLLDYLLANPPTSSSSATEWERGILAITASGKNPYNFGGINYVQNLESYHNNSQIGSATQINDDVFGLLALVAAGSNASSQIKQNALTFILSHQGADGGFSWSTTGDSDVDDTAAALQALVAAQKAGLTSSNLAAVILNAKNYILAAKNTDGGFASMQGDASNASTTSWVVMALNALGVTGADVTNANTYLRGNQEENGSFKWQSSSSGETFTTSYAVLALTGKYWPVKIFAGTTPTPSPTPTMTPTNTPTPTVLPTSIPSPTVTPTLTITPRPNPGDQYKSMAQLFKERMQQIKKAQRPMIERMKEMFKLFKVSRQR